MAKNKKLNLDAVNLLTVNSKAIDRAYKKAVKDALRQHKRAENPVAVWRGGKVVLLAPEEIILETESKPTDK